MKVNGYEIKPGANLYGANLSGANLIGANLYGAKLRGANLYGANLIGATDKTVYYETVEDAIDYEDARDVIAEKYPNRKVISVQEKNRGRMTEKYLLVERKPEFGFVEIRERNLKCFLLRFLIPISGLIDALISIFTLTLFTTNFRYVIAYRHIQEVALHEHEVLIRKLEDT